MFTSASQVQVQGADDFADEYAVAAAETQETIADDVLLPGPASWTPPERMLAIAAGRDHLIAVTAGQVATHGVPHWFDRIADEVTAAHMLSRQRDDDASVSRQSA